MSEILLRKLYPPYPVKAKDVIKIGNHYYEVQQIEHLYYEFRNLSSTGDDLGFMSKTYSIPDLTPPKDFVYYINAIGIAGLLSIQLIFPTGRPRLTPESKGLIKLDYLQANYLDPYPIRFYITYGDTIQLDIEAPELAPYGAVWFYGYKIKVAETQPSVSYIQLEDLR
jgi:hypothetical protein